MNLCFHIITPNHLSENKFYHSSYELHKKVWTEEFSKLFGSEYKYSSNDFTRQNYIQSLFLDDQCIALSCLRRINFSSPADKEDSWLSSWPQRSIEDLQNQGFNSASINSYFTVDKNYRKTMHSSGTSLSYIMGCLSVLHQVEVEEQLVLGMMRQDRSMHSLGQKWGSEIVEHGVLHNNIPTDLVTFKIPAIKKIMNEFPKIVFDIYKQKIDLTKTEVAFGKAA